MEWLRWWHGTVNDPKFRWVAGRAGVGLADVLAVWAVCLEHASASPLRGSIVGMDCDATDSHFGFTEGHTAAIIAALQAKGITDPDGWIRRWEDRQPKREDDSRKRVALHRSMKRDVTQCNAPEEIRLEKRREEKESPPLAGGGGGRDGRKLNLPDAWDGWRMPLHDLCNLHPFEWVQRAVDEYAGKKLGDPVRYLAKVLVSWKKNGGPPEVPPVRVANGTAVKPEKWDPEEQRAYYAARYEAQEAEAARKAGA
jgi:hypothetical protein